MPPLRPLARSSSRYLRHMAGLPSSRTVKWIGAPLAYCLGLTVAVGLYHTAADVSAHASGRACPPVVLLLRPTVEYLRRGRAGFVLEARHAPACRLGS